MDIRYLVVDVRDSTTGEVNSYSLQEYLQFLNDSILLLSQIADNQHKTIQEIIRYNNVHI